ncbi:UvrD-helicase domain-containing protein [Streptomyces capitiformicae]|uniref:DNA 3'-5' helicase n=1 Tax=Streptomyces capitiformicae TaxID=2014920 RepID=A0A918Z1F8_9ACTN|nr:UvrD-helicase domain-containing protein [Streptomyces capitiformicae]GHE33858.1 DNA helicase [Streptomyces capitiformicae]
MARSSSHRRESPTPDDQMDLFASAAPPPAPTQLSPHTELRQLITLIASRSGLGFKETNNRLNRRLGVVTRQGAPSEVIERAVVLAREWLAVLETPQLPDQPQPHRSPARRPRPARSGPTRPANASPAPTPEQEQALTAKHTGSHLVVQAGAGTGKTTLLTMLARSVPRERGLFLAYNRSVVDDAAKKFPPNVRCMTGHGLAMRETGHRYAARLNAPREPSWRIGERIGITTGTRIVLASRLITHKTISYSVLQTVRRFCHSADTAILPKHVPKLRGLPDECRPDLARLVLPYARRAWDDLQNPQGGAVRFEPDHYLKIWALTEPVIPADFLLLDEAQDTNRVLEKVFTAQRDHAQLIMVGDSAQAIYGWRGAYDVMTDFDGVQLTLTQSFRFGQAVADEANRWLTILAAPLRLKGAPALHTTVGPVDHPNAVLCRSNSGAIYEVLRLLENNKRVAMAGGGEALEKLAAAAGQLKAGRRTSHPELCLFTSWEELHEYATSDPAGGDLLPLVDIVDEYGPELVVAAVQNLHPEHAADVVVSTGHKAKGREWPTVAIGTDFEPRAGSTNNTADGNGQPDIDLDEARLAYVAVTRARERLDLGGLSWINQYPSTPSTMGEPCPSDTGPSPWDRLGPPPG